MSKNNHVVVEKRSQGILMSHLCIGDDAIMWTDSGQFSLDATHSSYSDFPIFKKYDYHQIDLVTSLN